MDSKIQDTIPEHMLKKALIFLILFSIAAAVVVLQALGKVGLVEVRSQIQAADFAGAAHRSTGGG